jgi:hypothetical protein
MVQEKGRHCEPADTEYNAHRRSLNDTHGITEPGQQDQQRGTWNPERDGDTRYECQPNSVGSERHQVDERDDHQDD